MGGDCLGDRSSACAELWREELQKFLPFEKVRW